MADDRLLITIEGKDGVSKTFVAVSKSADAAGKSVETAGKTGGAAMKSLATETEKTAKSAQDLERRYTAIGATIGTTIGVVSKLGASYREQRLDLQSLEAQYGTSADAVIDFTEAIQDSFNQSNDAARDSALIFATLYRNYEFGENQIVGLMERTADIASARGRNMTEVSQMIQNALRGEAEYIEQIGVTLNDTYVASEYAARGLGNWNTLTDEAAKAQFRYILLLEQTADTQGRAAEEAERAGGVMRRWINEVQDAGQTVGGFLGPAGEMAAELSMIALGAPIAGAAVGRMAGVIRNSAAAMRVFSVALGPIGISIAALAVLGGGLWQSFQEGKQATEDLNTAMGDLDTTIEMLRRRGEDGLAYLAEELKAEIAAFDAVEIGLPEMTDAQVISLAKSVSGGIEMGADDARDYLEKWNPDVTISLALDEQDLTAIYDKVDEALNDPNVDAAAFIEWADAQLDAAAATATFTDDLEARNAILERPLSDFSVAKTVEEDARIATRSVHGFSEALEENTDAAIRAALGLDKYVETIQDINDNAIAGAIDGLENLATARREAFAGIGEGVLGLAAAEAEEYAEWLEIVADNLNRLFAVTGMDDPLSMWNLSGAASDSAVLALNLTNAAEALDTVFRVVVGNTDAIASQVDSVQTWADELINVEGEYGKIDDLLRDGLITQEQYNAAQQAYNSLSEDNVRIQNDVLAIQAAQAPLIADQTAAMADYMAEIRDLPAEQQLIALGWMDATTAGRAMELQSLAIAAANGELGANGEEAFTSMITGAANADPVLKALLVDMGLISEGADGTITVNLDGAEGARSEIGMLTDALVGFIDLTDDGTINGSFSITAEDNASEIIRTVREGRDELDGSSATLSIYVNDYATLGINAAGAALDLLRGQEATVTVRTVYESQGLGYRQADGGVVGYAQGGVITELAEAGSEVVHFASGGSAYVAERGVYELSPGDYVMPHNQLAGNSYGGISVTFTGNFYGSNRQELESWADGYLVPALVDAINDERRGQVRV